MATRFSIVQYVPDTVADERVNIGMVAWDDKNIVCRFLNNWERVRRFSGCDISMLKDFARDFSRTVLQPSLALANSDQFLSAATIEGIIKKYERSIQFTRSRGAIEPPTKLIDDLVRLYLRDPSREVKYPRSRSVAARIVTGGLIAAVKKLYLLSQTEIKPEKYVKQRISIQGAIEKHTFDVGVVNGRIISAVRALSFETSDIEKLKREIEATNWRIEDAHKKFHQTSFGVLLWCQKEARGQKYFITRVVLSRN